MGEAGSVRDAVFQTRRHAPDLIVLDVTLPDGDGVDAIDELLAEAPEWGTCWILSMEDDANYVRRAFSNGANGYVLKDAASEELASAVREVAGGGRYLHAELGATDGRSRHRGARTTRWVIRSLTGEREVLRLLAEGHTNQEKIAAQLYISVRTAEAHRAHIMRKLGIKVLSESCGTPSTMGCSRASERLILQQPVRR